VLNGYTKYHAALFYQKKLAALGYNTPVGTDAISDTNLTSEIFVVVNADLPNAEAIAQYLGLPPSAIVSPTSANDQMVPAAVLRGSDIVLLVGADLSKQVPPKYNG
jgi:hypothetical protein